MASVTNNFDYRLAVRERERAMRLLEAMLNRAARSGEDLDNELLHHLQALISGFEPIAQASCRRS